MRERLISDQLAGFVLDTRLERIPPDVRRWAKLLMLDAIGNACMHERANSWRMLTAVGCQVTSVLRSIYF